jgi:hypothetical protein
MESVEIIQFTALSLMHFWRRAPLRHNPNHKDLDRTNNRLCNLEWMTQAENVKHAYVAGARDARGEGNGQAVMNDDKVREMRTRFPGRRGDYAAAARAYGISPRQAASIIQRTAWAHIA